MSEIKPLTRTKHRVTIEFDLDVAPELAEKIKQAVGQGIHSMLGYPAHVLYVDYSFNNPAPPKEIRIGVKEI